MRRPSSTRRVIGKEGRRDERAEEEVWLWGGEMEEEGRRRGRQTRGLRSTRGHANGGTFPTLNALENCTSPFPPHPFSSQLMYFSQTQAAPL